MAQRRKPEFGQGSYAYDESHDELAEITGKVVEGLSLHSHYDQPPARVGKDAVKIALVLADAYLELSDDFDEDAEDMLWPIFLGSVAGAVANADVDEIKSFDEESDIVSNVKDHAEAAWRAFAAEAGSDEDEDDEDDDG